MPAPASNAARGQLPPGANPKAKARATNGTSTGLNGGGKDPNQTEVVKSSTGGGVAGNRPDKEAHEKEMNKLNVEIEKLKARQVSVFLTLCGATRRSCRVSLHGHSLRLLQMGADLLSVFAICAGREQGQNPDCYRSWTQRRSKEPIASRIRRPPTAAGRVEEQ